jgi:hypothetical protein
MEVGFSPTALCMNNKRTSKRAPVSTGALLSMRISCSWL